MMEFLVIILFVAIVYLIKSGNKSVSERINHLEAEIHRLRDTIKNTETPPQEAKPVIQTPVSIQEKDYWKSSFEVVTEPPVFAVPPVEEPVTESEESLVDQEDIAAFSPIAAPEFAKPTAPVIPAKPGFFERNPDLEKFIGENLVSKIGIAILVLAIGFFVKYAIDNEWIGTIGRVAIGLVCGGILVGLAHRLQKSYHAFSSVLVGGGMAIFYFTIALAYHEYQLFGSTTTFIIMLVITAFAVALSLLYDRQEVAVIALVGGFASPFMASSGSNNYQALFIYLLILNTGLLVIAYHKAWRLLNLLAFIFTVILFWGWLGTLPLQTPLYTYSIAFIFATIFYVLFLAINIANNIKENRKFIASDFGILLSNTALYFSAGLYCLSLMKATDYNGLFSACLAVFNLGISYIIYRNQKTDPNILYLLTGITLTFVSLTAPLQLHGNHITLFWASEAVLIYWLFLKSGIKLLQLSATIIYTAMLISLGMDWSKIYITNSAALPIIFNRGFITTFYCGVASYVLYLLIDRKTGVAATSVYFIKAKAWLQAAAILLVYLAGLFEIIYQFTYYYSGTQLYLSYVQIYTFCFVLVAEAIIPQSFTPGLSTTAKATLLSVCISLYLLSTSASYELQRLALTTQPALHFQFIVTQIAIAILAAIIIYRLVSILRNRSARKAADLSLNTWLVCIAVVVYLSVEVNLFINQVLYSPATSLEVIADNFNKTGLAILWGLGSFAFMWLGMRYRFRPLRIVSLTLFSLTLVKLFVFDIRNIPVAGKIAAFFCLGVLLLVISFMYQRLKKIIIEEPAEKR